MSLLDQLKSLKKDRSLNPDRAWKKHMLLKLRQDLYEKQHRPGIFDMITSSFSLRNFTLAPIRVLASFVLIFMLGGTGLTFASKSSIPGDMLYPIKTATEEIQRLIAVSAEDKIQVNQKLAQERTRELNLLIEKKAETQLIQSTLKNLVSETESMVQILEQQTIVQPETVQIAEKAIETNIHVLKTYTPAIPRWGVQPPAVETSATELPSTDTQPVPVEQSIQPETPPQSEQPSPSTPPPGGGDRGGVQSPQESFPVGTTSTPQTPVEQFPQQPQTPPLETTPPAPQPIKTQPSPPPRQPQPTASQEPATNTPGVEQSVIIEIPEESTQPPAEEQPHIQMPEKVAIPEETYSEIVKSIDTLEDVKDDVTVTNIKVSTEENATQKVEEKIQQVQQQLQTHQEEVKNIPDPVKQEQAANLIKEAEFYLNVSNAELKDKDFVESFGHARESDKILDQVKTIIPPKTTSDQSSTSSQTAPTGSEPAPSLIRPVKKR